jgi:hypothetical protein
MGQTAIYTLQYAAAVSNNIAQSQALLAAGNFSLNGSTVTAGVATLDKPRRVLISSTGNDASAIFTVTGTDRYGNPQSESLAGTSGSSEFTVYDYKSVTKIAISAASGSNVLAGTNGVGSGPWVALNRYVTPGNTSLGIKITGTVNATAEYTYDDPNLLVPSNSIVPPGVFPMTTLQAVTTSIDGVLDQPATYVRWTVNSGSGTANCYVLQAGLAQ